MYKTARILVTLFLAALLLPACTRKQAPSPSDRVGTGLGARTGTGSGSGSGMDIIPNGGDLGGFAIDGSALDGSLQARGPSDGIGGGMYNGRQMVEGQLQSIYFGFDASSISTAERAKLQQAADHLRDNPSDGLLIEGHCDWYGTADYNIALGERRAKSARDYVTTLGINPMRVETLSKGSLEAVTGGSKHESAEDRRADLIILK